MSKVFKGEVKARIVETRFALSGKITGVSKHTGDTVKKWNLIASLDRKILQMELDRQLSDFEKVRADWDGFTQKYNVHNLVYYEQYNDISCAITREKQMKKWKRQWKINLIEKFNPDWIDLFKDLTA